MATPVEMPKLGNTVEDCLLSKWMRAKGDAVSAGDVIAEIETDKATFEVPAPVGGVLLEAFFPEGALVPVFANICAIGEPGENVSEFAPKAEASGSDSAAVPPALADPGIDRAPRGQPDEAQQQQVFVSPRARRFAADHAMGTEGVRGSGPGGRVLEQDLRDIYYSSPRQSTLERLRAADAPSAAPPAAAPLSSIREKIARRMREAMTQTAQYTLNSSADATALLSLRSRIKARSFEPDINLNDLVLFCTVKALLRMPQLNAELKDGKLSTYEAVHLGFATDTDRGLMVPVIRNAHGMGIVDLATAVKALAGRAVKGAFLPDDLGGATFTVSNLGNLGIESFTPILSPPQVAILGVDSIELRMVRRNGKIEMVDQIGLSLTCDHQVIDGAPGARFLGVVRECIEDVQALCGLKI
jgi:pyruvate dehydrogenase E2 component (dihydrolipoamide acetyltransferase)